MRIIALIGILIGFCCLGSGCSVADATGRRPLSMKGYELYSWQDGTDWRFALLEGTNRLKTLDEIKSPAVTLNDVAALDRTLGTLASGEQVFWEAASWIDHTSSPAGSIALPPAELRAGVAARCQELGIQLTIDE